MELRKLTLEDIKKIYDKHMVEAFPADEIRPFRSLTALYEAGRYLGFGGYEEGELRVYALFVTEGRTCLLDYFAVLQGLRGSGYGSKFLSAVQEKLTPFDLTLLEVERIDSARTDAEREIRRRRVGFYQKNGCRLSGVRSTVYGVDYSILYRSASGEWEDEEIRRRLSRLYKSMFPEEILRAKTRVY